MFISKFIEWLSVWFHCYSVIIFMTIFSVNISKPKHRQWSWSTFNHWLSIDWFSINKLIGIRSLAMSQHPIEGVEIKWALQTILLPAPGIVNDPLIFFSFLPENLIDERCSSLPIGQLLKLPIHNLKIQINRSALGVKPRRSGATGCHFLKQWQKDLVPNEVLQVKTNVYNVTKTLGTLCNRIDWK